jgi:hypothetical protein
MRALLVSLFIFSVFVVCIGAHAEEYAPTAAQKHFTAIVRGLPGVVSTEWESPISLWVKASSKAVGSPPRPQQAQQLSNILAERGRTALMQPFCVYIYQTRDNPLARTCVYY